MLQADEAAHRSFYQSGKRAPLPQNWERYGRTFTQWQLRGYGVHQLRPGISPEFLRRQGVVHVGKEHASELLGFPVHSGGLWIPYPGLNSTEMVVNGRKFGRLRLDQQTDSTRYLSARESGAHVYIPQGPPFGPTLVLAEGEFKAISLCEAGVRAIGIGGISSAMSQGTLISDLQKVLTRWPTTLIFFLGDTDTVFNFEFSREAVKLAKALPSDCALKLPRVPITRPKGIDDLREEELVKGDFLGFWKEITESAIHVDRRLTADTLAVKLIVAELPAIAASENKEALIQGLVEVSSFLDPLHLSLIAKAVGKALGLPAVDFRKTAQQKAATRKAEAGASAARSDRARSDDVARAINDPRPKIEIPASRDRLTSEFAAELGRVMARYSFFVKDGIVVYPDTEKTSLAVVTGRAFRTAIEDYVVPFKVKTGNLVSLNRTISREEAESVLESSQFIKCLPRIRAVNNARFPVLRATGRVELLPEGYDPESLIYTNPGGPKMEDLGLEKGKELLLSKFEEFCFQENDRERATAVALAAMLTLFVFNIIPRGTLRPGFLYTANAEGGGKTLLARLAIVPRLGFTPIGSLPEQEEEIEKRIAAAAIAGAPTLFFDNGKRHISSGSLERAITATNLEGRVLGKSQSYQIENMITVFLTGNGATISGDLRRRVLHRRLVLTGSYRGRPPNPKSPRRSGNLRSAS